MGKRRSVDRRTFLKTGLAGCAMAAVPAWIDPKVFWGLNASDGPDRAIEAVMRPETRFAGIRKPIKTREELGPRIEELKRVCAGKIDGPLTHIFRFDTPVDGYDSEIGFPVTDDVHEGDVVTHTLRRMHFYSSVHHGPVETLKDTRSPLYQYMNKTGLSAELELVEVFHHTDDVHPEKNEIQVMASFLAWPEVYREQLVRVLGADRAEAIWAGGQKMTPHIDVDTRCAWVAASIASLKSQTDADQQFDILSRVALVRPIEDVMKYKKMYDASKDIQVIFDAQNKQLEQTPTGGFLDPHTFDGKTLHLSKPPYNKAAYVEAKTQKEKRRAFCFCNLVREAKDPQIDPIFCYRAAGWARQFWEPILGVEFKSCRITHSILKGDGFCAWDYAMPEKGA